MDLSITLPARFVPQFALLHPQGAEKAALAALRLYLDLGTDGLAALQDRAAQLNLTPAATITTLLAQPPRLPKTRQSNAARDAAIANEYLAGGITYPMLAAKYGLSVVRTTQIVANARALRAQQTPQTDRPI